MVIRVRKGFLGQRLGLLRQRLPEGGTIICTSLHTAIGLNKNGMSGILNFPGFVRAINLL